MRSPICIKDEKLGFVDELIDNEVNNRLLSYDGYTPSMRDLFPCRMFRTELLKAINEPSDYWKKVSQFKVFYEDFPVTLVLCENHTDRHRYAHLMPMFVLVLK